MEENRMEFKGDRTISRLVFPLVLMLLITEICLAGEIREQGDKQLFLAYNIWKTRDYANQ